MKMQRKLDWGSDHSRLSLKRTHSRCLEPLEEKSLSKVKVSYEIGDKPLKLIKATDTKHGLPLYREGNCERKWKRRTPSNMFLTAREKNEEP